MRPVRIVLVNVGFRLPLYPLVTPPLGIMYLAAYLRTRFDAEFLLINQKLNNVPDDEVVKQAAAFEPDVVGLSVMTPAAYHLPRLTAGLKAALPNALVALGGPHVSAFGCHVLRQSQADAALPGEGELGTEMLLRALQEGAGLESVPGLFWRDEDGGIVVNPGAAPLIDDLDSLPFPAYDLIDLPAYWRRQGIAPIPRRKYASLFSSRGCPYSCNYCHNIFGKRKRKHSAERIVEEAAYYQKQYGIHEIEFFDDIFNLDHKRLMRFCELMTSAEQPLKFSFPTALRTDILRDEEIDALADAGMYYCGFALESGSPRLQKLMGKNLDIDKFVDNVNKVAAKGIYTNGFAMLGFPSETEEEMLRTVDVACATDLHTISFFTVTPFPGTELYRSVRALFPERIRDVVYDNLDFSSFTANLSDVPDDRFYQIQREANRRFFFNPKRILRILRDYPKPLLLPLYIPPFIKRATKGLLWGASTPPVVGESEPPSQRDECV